MTFAEPIHTEQAARRVAPVPHLVVKMERLALDRSEGWDPVYEDVEAPVLVLSFRYGTTELRASDERDRFFVGDGGIRAVPRDRESENRARRLLESFGAVEIGCIDGCVPEYGSVADYVIKLDGDVHAFCSFSAYALPQLRAMGWEVEVADDYPYRVLSGDVPWYALASDDERPDWFSFELGIELDGQRLSLLPALLDLLDQSPDEVSLSSVLKSAPRFVALRADERLYVPVPVERLRRVLSVLRDLYDGRTSAPLARGRGFGDQETLWLPSCRAGAMAELGRIARDHTEGLTLQAPKSLVDLAASLERRPSASEAPELHTLRATLRPYQREGVAWLQKLRSLGLGGVLADDMGLGKTLQTIAHLCAEKEAGRASGPSLIIAPTSLVGNWQRELERFAPGLRVLTFAGSRRSRTVSRIADSDVVITTYPLLIRDREILAEHAYDSLVLDEAQAIKNPSSQAHRAAVALTAKHKLCLSGTPLENNLGELQALFDFLMPGLLGSRESFRCRFRQPIEQGSAEALAELRERVCPFILRRVKTEVAKELPPKTEIVRPIDLPDDQRELYESIRVAAHSEVRQVIRKKGLAASTLTVLDALMKLRQVCCDPRLVRVPAARPVKRSAKLEALLELVHKQRQDGHRILVFSQFTSMLDLISQELFSAQVDHLMLTGNTQNRQARIDAFQEGRADIFLISLKAGGTGLNLTRADTIIHYDPWWNPAAQDQATDRAYRIGQTDPVFVYSLIVAGSVEERMLHLQQKKRRLAGSILGGDAQSLGGLAVGDVDDLFAPLDD
jgi:superfamily II DNA or RNA helicase